MANFKINQYEKSHEWFDRAIKVIPSGVYGHLGPAEGNFIPVSAWPFFSEKAKGTYFWDVDGNKFIDYMCAYGPNILGYGDPDVDKAALEQAKLGNCVTSPSYKMVELAELMVDTVNTADWAFFAKNGNDVTTLAIMAARNATHRKKIPQSFRRSTIRAFSPRTLPTTSMLTGTTLTLLRSSLTSMTAKLPHSSQLLTSTVTILTTSFRQTATGRRFVTFAQRRASYLSSTTFVQASVLTLQVPTTTTALRLI